MRYLIWDFDDTLGYREGGKWTMPLLEIITEALPELGVTFAQLKPFLEVGYPWHTPERPHPELDTPAAWWAALDLAFTRALVGVGVPAERVPALIAQFPARYTDLTRWRLFSDTLPALTTLAAAGWQHVLLTNHVPELPSILDHLGLTPHLAAVFNSAQTGYEKPHPRAFRTTLDFIGPADAVWMIGDNYTADILGAEAHGLPAILVRKPHADARYCCADLAGVVENLAHIAVG